MQLNFERRMLHGVLVVT